MGNLIFKILEWLLSIQGDKYKHFTLGAIISALPLWVLALCGVTWWVCIAVSAALGIAAACLKEFCLNSKVDYWDIVATVAGAAVPIISYIV